MKAYIVDGVRTPIGRYNGALSHIRPDDLAAKAIASLAARHSEIPSDHYEEVVLGAANQSGEDNRNVARMALLLSGLDHSIPAVTVNRLCGSGADAIAYGMRSIKARDNDLVIVGGVESMSRAPYVMGKAETVLSREQRLYDTTLGWRFINKALEATYGCDTMGETAENVAADYNVTRQEQDLFALSSQEKAAKAIANGRFNLEIGVELEDRSGNPIEVDEHPRATTLEKLAKLKPAFRDGGSVTAGNSSGINDGAVAILLASEVAVERYGLTPIAEVVSCATAGVEPRTMGIGPLYATKRLLERQEISINQIDLIEINEAFASQVIASLRGLGIDPHSDIVNRNGGAIALGHPLGMSGARLALTLSHEMRKTDANLGVATMCIGVGQGISLLLRKP
ncbi:MAG: acetyl-CoA C-acyltransferase [Actinomycetota bacterium]|nr:acetyl-CoA C-acyltransferase [Actinomycetota bacterium]